MIQFIQLVGAILTAVMLWDLLIAIFYAGTAITILIALSALIGWIYNTCTI